MYSDAARSTSCTRTAITLGERRPLMLIAAPFPHRAGDQTSREDEDRGLAAGRALVAELAAMASNSGRTVRLLLSAQPFGAIHPAGVDAALAEKFDEWGAAHAPEGPTWEREGWVSIWIGSVPREDLDALLEERYGNDRSISRFARALGVYFYDHDFFEALHEKTPRPARDIISKLSFAESFSHQVAEALASRQVDTAIALYDADFSRGPVDIARKRLRFAGAYAYTVPHDRQLAGNSHGCRVPAPERASTTPAERARFPR